MEALHLVAKPVPPRETAQVRFTNGKGAFEAPIGTILEEYVRAAYPDRWRMIVGGDRWEAGEATPIRRLLCGTDRCVAATGCASTGVR
jgi:hypothetical protein